MSDNLQIWSMIGHKSTAVFFLGPGSTIALNDHSAPLNQQQQQQQRQQHPRQQQPMSGSILALRAQLVRV